MDRNARMGDDCPLLADEGSPVRSSHPLLATRDLAVGYGRRAVVDGIELEVRAGQICTLVGPNGAGKSTILKTIARQLAPIEGTVALAGKDLGKMDGRELARTMAILTTERVDPELMTCEDVVAMGRHPHTGRLGLLAPADRRAIASAMELVGVEALAQTAFSQVSDGQRQRVMLARAICQEPRILVLDEPTSFLDVSHKLAFLRLMCLLAHERGVAVVMSLHELELARHVSDVVVCVADGCIDKVGSPSEVFRDGYVRRLYDVRDDAFDQIYPGLDDGGDTDLTTDGTSPALDATSPALDATSHGLRRGVTSGTCAALATAAATRLLLAGEAPRKASLVTPKGIRVSLPVEDAHLEGSDATCGIRKDAGDDPDITNGMLVLATVRRAETGITIEGGPGVGTVTKPGLDQPVGASAINRVPRQMIEQEARETADELGYEGGLHVTISIPGGEELAQRTFNPRLGVVGGLSILGTSGIEEPMSEQALIDTIRVELRQVHALGADSVVLLPGNYARDFVASSLPQLASLPRVTYSNYLGDALDATVELGFEDVLVVGHIGKLVKLAGGIMNTHSKVADCRMELLCAHAAICGAGAEVCARIMDAATTDAGLAILDEAGMRENVVQSLLDAMQRQLDHRTQGKPRAGALTFSNGLGLLGLTRGARKILALWDTEEGDR